MSRLEGHTPKGRAMGESGGGVKAWLTLTKPGVVVLLQITALCAVLSHDLLEASGFSEMDWNESCLLYTSPSPRDPKTSRMPSSA